MDPIIPGAYERNTLTHRQPGSMGGHGLGSVAVPFGSFPTMDAVGLADRQREGGRIQRRIPWWRRLLALLSGQPAH